MFELQIPLSPRVLVYPTVLEDAVMYVIISEAAEDAKIDLRDKTTGAPVDSTDLLRSTLPSL